MKKLFMILISIALLLNVLPAVAEEGASIADAQVGDTVTFGRFEQDNKTANGPEDIEWTVLAERDGAKLLLAKGGLIPMAFSEINKETTWESSTPRDWLNNGFYAIAFNTEERGRILTSHLENADNPEYGTEGGEDTDDRVFLLSIDELNEYLPVQEDRITTATAFAKARGAFISDTNKNTWWMLRSPGKDLYHSAIVNSWGFSGGVYPNLDVPYEGESITVADDCLRPALWVAPEGTEVLIESAPDGSMAPWEVLDALGDELYQNTYTALVMGDPVEKGSKGDAAKGVQQTLVALGQDIAVDGSVGAKTIAALNAVQEAFGLEKTDSVDADTYIELLQQLLQ